MDGLHLVTSDASAITDDAAPLPPPEASLAELKSPSLEGLPGLMRALDSARAALPPGEWARLCRSDARIAAWRDFLMADPYSRHARLKPRGYPGDARLMDFAYRHTSVARSIREAPPVGQAIYRLTSTEPLSVSAVRRLDVIAHHIRCSAEAGGPVSVASLAAGHARELEALDEEHRAALGAFHAVDSDGQSLAEIVAGSGARVPVRPVERNIMRLRPGDVGSNHLVYSAGLFDYLDARAAQRVLGIMASAVRPGGRMIIGNLADDAANLGYCEAILDWWMIPRSREQLRDLAVPLKGQAWAVRDMRVGCFRYLVAERHAA
jgi:extracellular factor (EF) 3-hydroxypalmitic acid methyl ester biosynthesis protein